MRFIHFADSHLDGFRDERLNRLGIKNFFRVIDDALSEKVDFVVLSGDLFNTALPRVDVLKDVISGFKKLFDANIPVYAIPGSHDFSPRGRTMFEVLERGGFLINVMKGNVKDEKLHLEFTIDKKTGAILTGIMGKKGMLDKAFYEHLVLPEKPANNFSIFLFHTGITEMKPKELEQMTSYSVKSLPEGFDYYAGGHVHIRKRFHQALYSEVVYPGPTFPNSFSELEKLNHGSYVFFDSEKLFPLEDDQTKTVHFEFRKIESKKVIKFFVDASDKKPDHLTEEMIQTLGEKNLVDSIVLLRIEGVLDGNPSEIDFNEVMRTAYDNGAYIVLKNTYKLRGNIIDDDEEKPFSGDVESETIDEFRGIAEVPFDHDEKELIKKLLAELSIEPLDGERKIDFVERVIDLTKDVFETTNEK